MVAYRTLHRFATERCGYRARETTVRVDDGEPGVELQVDFGHMGYLVDPADGRRRKVHALIFTAVVSRHMFVWLTYSQTLTAVIAGCEAAWGLLRWRVQGPGPGQPQAGRDRRRRGQPAPVHRLAGLRPARRVRHRPREGPLAQGQTQGRAGGAVRARQLLGRGAPQRPGRRAGPCRAVVLGACRDADPRHDPSASGGGVHPGRGPGAAAGAATV